MEEKNKHSLKKAIDNLPKYSPKDNLWDKLSSDLDGVQSDPVLHEAIDKLPTYPAPAEAWAIIEKELPARTRKIWPKILSMAAAVALLVGFVWSYMESNFDKEVIHITHREMQVKQSEFVQLNPMNGAQRDSAFKSIIRAQKESSEKAKEILAELEKLDDSKRRLKSRLSKFDLNKQLEEKLNKIEAESIELQKAYLATI